MAGKLAVGTDGRVNGPARITWNKPWPCRNGEFGSGAMSGVLMHTMDGDLPGTVSWFNNAKAEASAHFGIAQDGSIHQFGPIGKGWIAWHAKGANATWYGIEHADHRNPALPLTPEQVTASAQLVECLAAFAGFPLAVADSPGGRGYGWHGMGGAAWGNHPDCPGPVRKRQRGAVITAAAAIRAGRGPAGGPVKWVTAGQLSLADLAAQHGTTAAGILSATAAASPGGVLQGPVADLIDILLARGPVLPAGLVLYLPAQPG
jgi:hypothetical protein